MTENEAIEYMENEVRCIKQASHCDRDCLKCGLVKEEQPLLESFAVAMQALEEIQQYRAIGTVEEFKALKEKNEPKEIHRLPMDDMCLYYENHCPKCDSLLVVRYKHCPKCGQKLDWQ